MTQLNKLVQKMFCMFTIFNHSSIIFCSGLARSRHGLRIADQMTNVRMERITDALENECPADFIESAEQGAVSASMRNSHVNSWFEDFRLYGKPEKHSDLSDAFTGTGKDLQISNEKIATLEALVNSEETSPFTAKNSGNSLELAWLSTEESVALFLKKKLIDVRIARDVVDQQANAKYYELLHIAMGVPFCHYPRIAPDQECDCYGETFCDGPAMCIAGRGDSPPRCRGEGESDDDSSSTDSDGGDEVTADDTGKLSKLSDLQKTYGVHASYVKLQDAAERFLHAQLVCVHDALFTQNEGLMSAKFSMHEEAEVSVGDQPRSFNEAVELYEKFAKFMVDFYTSEILTGTSSASPLDPSTSPSDAFEASLIEGEMRAQHISDADIKRLSKLKVWKSCAFEKATEKLFSKPEELETEDSDLDGGSFSTGSEIKRPFVVDDYFIFSVQDDAIDNWEHKETHAYRHRIEYSSPYHRRYYAENLWRRRLKFSSDGNYFAGLSWDEAHSNAWKTIETSTNFVLEGDFLEKHMRDSDHGRENTEKIEFPLDPFAKNLASENFEFSVSMMKFVGEVRRRLRIEKLLVIKLKFLKKIKGANSVYLHIN